MPMFQPAPRPRFSASTTRTSGKRSRTNADGAVARAVVDDDRLDPAQRVEALLDPRQRVVGDDDGGDARLSHARPRRAPRRGARRAA